MPGCRLPGLRNLNHQWLPDPESTYQHLARVAPIRHFRSLVPRREFYQWAGLLEIGDTLLLSYSSSNVSFRIEDAPVVHLVACFNGHRRVNTPGAEVHCHGEEITLLPLGQREAWGSHSAAVISLHPARIARVAALMAGAEAHQDAFTQQAAWFEPLRCSGVHQAQLLHALLHTIDASVAVHPRLPFQLGFDDSLYRLAATLLHPNRLLHQEPADRQRWCERQGRQSLDELIDYIRSNLHQPLRLSDLEARSHYSSRALQYAFRQRLGCTPKQWIRSIAWNCGYCHMGLFSSDFKRRFGLSPSQARRWCPAQP